MLLILKVNNNMIFKESLRQKEREKLERHKKLNGKLRLLVSIINSENAHSVYFSF